MTNTCLVCCIGQEEDDLAGWLLHLAKTGHPQKKNDLLDAVQKLVTEKKRQTPFTDDRPGETWYRGFLKRHPDISVREPEGVSGIRAVVTEASIRKWFDTAQSYLSNQEGCAFDEIMADPRRVINTDETNFSLCPKTGKVLGPKGWKNVYDLKRGNEKDTLTVLGTFSADGSVLPGMIIYPYQRPPREVVESIPAPWALGLSESGWMRSDTFYEYVVNVLDPYLVEKNVPKPVVLFLDGHRSHMSYGLSDECSKRKIIIYTLLPNATHILQPADVAVFKPLKTAWKVTVRGYQKDHPNAVVIRASFAPLIDQTMKVAAKDTTIRNGFRVGGLYPWDPNAVDYTKCITDTPTQVANDQQTSLLVKLEKNILDLNQTIADGQLNGADQVDCLSRFWALVNVAIASTKDTHNHGGRGDEDGRRDNENVENGDQEEGENERSVVVESDGHEEHDVTFDANDDAMYEGDIADADERTEDAMIDAASAKDTHNRGDKGDEEGRKDENVENGDQEEGENERSVVVESDGREEHDVTLEANDDAMSESDKADATSPNTSMHDSSLLDELYSAVIEVDAREEAGSRRIPVTSAIASTSQAFSTHTFYPKTNRDGPDRKKRKYVERYPCAVTSEKWRQMYTEKEEAKERDDAAKQNRKDERERKRQEKEELKVKRAQEVNDRKNNKKDSDSMRKDVRGKAKNGKKRQSTTENEDTKKRTKRNPCSVCGESVGMTGPGKFGLQCSSCRNKFHVSCIGKSTLNISMDMMRATLKMNLNSSAMGVST